jgi:hypothetical protein
MLESKNTKELMDLAKQGDDAALAIIMRRWRIDNPVQEARAHINASSFFSATSLKAALNIDRNRAKRFK